MSSWGGKRNGSGRPKSEDSKMVRVPVSAERSVKAVIALHKQYPLLADCAVFQDPQLPERDLFHLAWALQMLMNCKNPALDGNEFPFPDFQCIYDMLLRSGFLDREGNPLPGKQKGASNA